MHKLMRIAAVFTAVLSISAHATEVSSEVSVSASWDNSSVGSLAQSKQLENIDICEVRVDGATVAKGKLVDGDFNANFKQDKGTYQYQTLCFGPEQVVPGQSEKQRQLYFHSAIVTKSIDYGADNTVNLTFFPKETKGVILNINSPHVSPGQNIFLMTKDGVKHPVTVPSNGLIVMEYLDKAPAYAVYTDNGVQIGILQYARGEFALMPYIVCELAPTPMDVPVVIVYSNPKFILNGGVTLDDIADANHQFTVGAIEIPEESYQVRVRDKNTNSLIPGLDGSWSDDNGHSGIILNGSSTGTVKGQIMIIFKKPDGVNVTDIIVDLVKYAGEAL